LPHPAAVSLFGLNANAEQKALLLEPVRDSNSTLNQMEAIVMRKLITVLAIVCLSQTVLAQDPCSAEKAKIDARLAMPGYTAQQKQRGEELKNALNMMCSMGGAQAAAPMMAQLDQILPPPSEADGAMSRLSKDELTNEYLQGKWCRGGQEATSYEFASDGTYRYAVVGFNVGPDGHHFFRETLLKSEFLEQFDHLRAKEEIGFVTSVEYRGKHSESRFERGECSFIKAGAAG
jgi:hypothetical protein